MLLGISLTAKAQRQYTRQGPIKLNPRHRSLTASRLWRNHNPLDQPSHDLSRFIRTRGLWVAAQTNAGQRRIALHETGHAIVAALLGAVPVTREVGPHTAQPNKRNQRHNWRRSPNVPHTLPLLHPSMAETYHTRVLELVATLSKAPDRDTQTSGIAFRTISSRPAPPVSA